jgi:hypothetical protein
MQTSNIRPGKYFWGIGATLTTLLIGGWLMLAPFALGYQPYGASWVGQTENDFWLGLGLVVVSCVGIGLFVLSLLSALRAAGVIRPRPRSEPVPAVPRAAAPTGQYAAPVVPEVRLHASELERAMAVLAATLAADLAERRRTDNAQPAAADTAGGRE